MRLFVLVASGNERNVLSGESQHAIHASCDNLS